MAKDHCWKVEIDCGPIKIKRVPGTIIQSKSGNLYYKGTTEQAFPNNEYLTPVASNVKGFGFSIPEGFIPSYMYFKELDDAIEYTDSVLELVNKNS